MSKSSKETTRSKRKFNIARIVAIVLVMALVITMVIGLLSQQTGYPTENVPTFSTVQKNTAQTITSEVQTSAETSTTTAELTLEEQYVDPGSQALVTVKVEAGKIVLEPVEGSYMEFIKKQTLPVLLMIDGFSSRTEESVKFFQNLAVKYQGKIVLLHANSDVTPNLERAFGFKTFPGFIRFENGLIKATANGFNDGKRRQIENLILMEPQG